jgi:hypothetical protein
MVGIRMEGRGRGDGQVVRRVEATPLRGIVAVSLVALVAAGLLQFRMTRSIGMRDEAARLDHIPPVELLEAMPSLPRRLAADLLWIRALQSYGYHRQADQDFTPLVAHFDAVTRVDPRFEMAYDFGGLVIAQEGGDPDRGLALLMRGMVQLPDSWLLPFETGFVYYVCVGDAVQAARYFNRAAGHPDAPEYVKHFAAFSSSRAGRRDLARFFWTAILQESDREVIRRLAEEALLKLSEEETRLQKRQSLSEERPPAGARTVSNGARCTGGPA